MSSRAVARGCLLTAVAFTTVAAVFVWHERWTAAVILAYVALVLALLACGINHHDRTIRARHERARRAAAVDARTLPAPTPCCSFWLHSDGEIHGPDCARPPLPRRDGRLDERERAVFEEITAHFDDRSAA
ncbi:hypothetical protein [Streptomyces sp. NPDC001139]